jgi:hypothetical protein
MSLYHEPGELEKFDPVNYPAMDLEISGIISKMENTSSVFRSDIIVSRLKNDSIRTEWMNANPVVTTMATAGNFGGINTELLFGSCRWNKRFRQDLERYIKERLCADN